MEGVDFQAFLELSGNDGLLQLIRGVREVAPIPKACAARLVNLVRLHMAMGSMPDVVETWIRTHDFGKVDQAIDGYLEQLIHACALELHMSPGRCAELLRLLPRQMARENARFRQSRAREESAGLFLDPLMLLLLQHGVLIRTRRIERPAEPAESYVYQSQYKYYVADTGLFRRLARLPAAIVNEERPDLSRFRGILTESYVLSGLSRFCGEMIWYWKSGSHAEVDFVVSLGGTIIPVEVKTARNVKSRSLALYRKLYQPELALRYSLLNLKLDDDLLNIPLFMVQQTPSLVHAAIIQGTP